MEVENTELQERFALPNSPLDEDVLRELQSIMRLHSITPEELFFKWESYCIKMGSEGTKLDLATVRDFKKDLHEVLERETRSKIHVKASDKKLATGATPRTSKVGSSVDVFDMVDNALTGTPRIPMNAVNGNSVKRKSNFDTPTAKAYKSHAKSSPQTSMTPVGQSVPFADRKNAGEIEQTLNDHIQLADNLSTPFPDPRIKLKANTELSKFAYKPMAMKLSGASEILDDRIDAFVELVQGYHKLDDGAFGNAAAQSTNEIVVVGRVTSDNSETKLSSSLILLETSRRMGGGLRVPLHLDNIASYDFFPGKIVALRGNNASGEYFNVSEILDLPIPGPPASKAAELAAVNNKVQAGAADSSAIQPLNILVGAGPYTADTNLDFEPFQALCDKAKEASADALVLVGPFLDVEHPLLISGDIPPLNPALKVDPDAATLVEVFQSVISVPLQRLAQAVPSITILMIPSVRDAVNKHVSWPQDKMARKDLGLPKQVAFVTNPVMISLNEMMLGVSSQDVLYELKQERCASGAANSKTLGDGQSQDILARLSRHLIEQQHFYPIFPPTSRSNLPKPSNLSNANDENKAEQATGSMLDISYSALGEWHQIKPDILITPSVLAPFAKVVEGVVVINPGPLSKKRAAGTLARLTVNPRVLSEEETAQAEEDPDTYFVHKVFERSRVDIVRV